MKNILAVLVLVGILVGGVMFSGGLKGCVFERGPDRPGAFKGARGWESLKAAPDTLFSTISLFVPDRIYEPSTWTQHSNEVSRDFSVRVYAGGQDTRPIYRQLDPRCYLVVLRDSTIPTDGPAIYAYPKEMRGRLVLATPGITLKGESLQPETILQNFGPKVVEVYKFYDVSPGKWLLRTVMGDYFMEIR